MFDSTGWFELSLHKTAFYWLLTCMLENEQIWGIVAAVVILIISTEFQSLFSINVLPTFNAISLSSVSFCSRLQSKTAGEQYNWSLFLGIWLKNRLTFSDHKNGGTGWKGSGNAWQSTVDLPKDEGSGVPFFSKMSSPCVIVQYLKTRRTGKRING